MRKLPLFLAKYFWDVEFEKIDLRKSKIYVLKRILEYGDQDAVHWMWRNFRKLEIKDTVSRYRGYSRKSANFWRLFWGCQGGVMFEAAHIKGAQKNLALFGLGFAGIYR